MKFTASLSIALAAFGLTVCAHDALHFRDLASGTYLTPWYPPQWWKAPYTHLALSLREGRDYWVPNAIGSERWHIRETPVGGVVFWTAMERVPNS